MDKKLKPYTIIPENLYVQRDADKQVRNIISDMGRPGYVLVSRQMGKTNLLLNAKKNLETEKDAYVYIDLSNTFPTAKGCFENIIDIAIETYESKFDKVKSIIIERRKELKDTPPHKQHTNELRFLLQALNGGKLVIILDEIDALTKTDYSDQIFSQIRSTYFGARVNYNEFYNLTYLLSGVVEPTEIIKDPKVSPFNIGQKIYLNDFSKDEFERFIRVAELNIDKESIERIFYWTNGNPRISWDVCSELENKLQTDNCSPELIDKIVQELYLKSFDKAPIDNIREIVEHDREIRNSIVEIEFKKGKHVSDKIKSKLYLAGIINYDEDDIIIKNEVIRRSLSYEWIRSLEEADKGLINLAFEEYKAQRFLDSFNTFEKYLKDNSLADDADKANTYFVIGHCAYIIKNFDKALEYLNKADFDAEDEAIWHYKTLHLKGLTLYKLNRYEESLSFLRKIIDNGKKDSVYAIALLNYSAIALQSDTITHRDEAARICEEIINETAFKREKLTDTLTNEIKSIAHYNLGQLNEFEKDLSKAIENYKLAIEYSNETSKPKYILALLRISTNQEENSALMSKLIHFISSSSIAPKDEDPDKPMDFNYNEFKEISLRVFKENKQTFIEKIQPELFKLGDKSTWSHLFDLSIFSINNEGSWDIAIEILKHIYESRKTREENIEEEVFYGTLKLLAYGSDKKVASNYDVEYIKLFKKKRHQPVDFIDMEIFINLIYSLTTQKKYDEAIRYSNYIVSLKSSVAESNLRNYLLIYHLQLNLFVYKNDTENIIRKAKEIIHLINNENAINYKSNLLDDSGFEIIKQNAESIANPKPIALPLNSNTKIYGRNQLVKVRYKDGTTIETKYKKIENDLTNGICIILHE